MINDGVKNKRVKKSRYTVSLVVALLHMYTKLIPVMIQFFDAHNENMYTNIHDVYNLLEV